MDHTEAHSTISAPVINSSVEKIGKKSLAIRITLNFFIYLTCYLVFFILKKKGFIYDVNYIKFLPIMIAGWGLGSLLSRKFRIKPEHILLVRLKRYYISLVVALGTIAILLLQTELSISRFVVVGSLISAFLIEAGIELLKMNGKIEIPKLDRGSISYTLLIIDFLLLTFILFYLYEKRYLVENLDENQIILVVCTYLSWLFAATITHQFKPFGKVFNFWKAIGVQLKFYILIIALLSIIVYVLQVPDQNSGVYLGSILLYFLLSLTVTIFLYLDKVPQKTDEIQSNFLHAYELKIPDVDTNTVPVEIIKYKLEGNFPKVSKLKSKLEFIYFKQYPEVFSFLERKLDLSTFDIDRTSVFRSADPYNVSTLLENHLELFINLHQLNDIRRINAYLIEINKRLIEGGVLVLNFEPIRYRYKRFFKKYPFLVANIFYLSDFIRHRVIPKLPVIRKVFFAFTKGKNRALSLAEGLGRLYYCGFEVMDLKDLDNICYVIAKKIKEPSDDKNPSYSPVIKMKRIGKNGNPIFVYKFRTMHPYSEYLQEFVYQQNQLATGGKFKDDFRITTWGKVLRRFWIDELPMITNWFKGDCKLFGVRPLSMQYNGLYHDEFRERRLKYKPGLVPPYYVDMPTNLDEIIKSEEKYLDAFDKNRSKTDFIYFWKACNNILLNKQRSR